MWPHRWQPTRLPHPAILQARTLEWVAISFSNAWKWKVKGKSLSHIWLLATPWTAAHQAPPSMGFSRQEYWSELPLPSQDHLWSLTYLHLVWYGAPNLRSTQPDTIVLAFSIKYLKHLGSKLEWLCPLNHMATHRASHWELGRQLVLAKWCM